MSEDATKSKERSLILRQREKFLASGLARAKFTKRLYKSLIRSCCFIAHYDLDGFYQYYFCSGVKRTFDFLSQFDARGTCASVELGGASWLDREGDLGRAMVEAAKPYVADLIEQVVRKQEKADLLKARRLIRRANPELLRRIEAQFGPLADQVE